VSGGLPPARALLPLAWRRALVALAVAVAVHLLLVQVIQQRALRTRPVPVRSVPLSLVEQPPIPPPAEDEPTPPDVEVVEEEPPPRPPRAPPPPVESPGDAPAPPAATPEQDPPPADAPAPSPAPPPDPGPVDSLMRLPTAEGGMAGIVGAGATGPRVSLGALGGALDIRAEGLTTDAKAAARRARRLLEEDLADDAVSAGLADDYFRELHRRLEDAWRPAMDHLNDAGEAVTQIGMMKSLVTDPSGFGEMWQLYLDLAKQYANGEQPTIEPARRERLRELMRSRRGAFRYQAILEMKLTQGPDGRVVTLETLLPSGHPQVDEHAREALVQAIAALPDDPPARVHRGRVFSSWWRLRATWVMVPPTALFTGSGFDITAKGFQVDVPFDIKLKKNVLLLRTDAKVGVGVEELAAPGLAP
jgi:hypothetical protein